MDIGGLIHGYTLVVEPKSTSQRNNASKSPGYFFILQTTPYYSGSCFAFPIALFEFTFAVFFGTGILMARLVANKFFSKIDFILNNISKLL